MLTKKKKISRKEIKEDKLVTFYYKAYGFLQDNLRTVIIAASSVFVVGLLIYFYVSNAKSENETAFASLSQIMPVYEQGNYQLAIDGAPEQNVLGLKAIVEQNGSTEAGEMAKIMLANSYFALGKYDEALKLYEDYSGSNDLYEAAAFAGRASYAEYKKEFDKAAEFYKDAAGVSDKNAANADYLIKAAANLIEAGKNADAKELLLKVQKDYSDSPYSQDVDKYLSQVE